MNKFMSTLTEAYHGRKNATVLYVPNEDLASQPFEKLAENHDLTQRMESVLIHWTRKIKEVLHNLSSQAVAVPLDEIEFWEVRCRYV